MHIFHTLYVLAAISSFLYISGPEPDLTVGKQEHSTTDITHIFRPEFISNRDRLVTILTHPPFCFCCSAHQIFCLQMSVSTVYRPSLLKKAKKESLLKPFFNDETADLFLLYTSKLFRWMLVILLLNGVTRRAKPRLLLLKTVYKSKKDEISVFVV